MIFAWFENRVGTTAPPRAGPPPAGLVAFYRHFLGEYKGLFLALFAVGLAVAIVSERWMICSRVWSLFDARISSSSQSIVSSGSNDAASASSRMRARRLIGQHRGATAVRQRRWGGERR